MSDNSNRDTHTNKSQGWHIEVTTSVSEQLGWIRKQLYLFTGK